MFTIETVIHIEEILLALEVRQMSTLWFFLLKHTAIFILTLKIKLYVLVSFFSIFLVTVNIVISISLLSQDIVYSSLQQPILRKRNHQFFPLWFSYYTFTPAYFDVYHLNIHPLQDGLRVYSQEIVNILFDCIQRHA